jgi:hypothetical protein
MDAPALALALLVILAALLLYRFAWWRPDLGLRRLELAIMYLGYLAIVLQLLLEILAQLGVLGGWAACRCMCLPSARWA